ncbi:MAG: Peptidase propeptide and YPEB domain protein [Candidatus Accumulibacter adjunctus]|uniref:Peptidase propeptide and YPEB domain protein n=1 Tax=Candidatus Accumulibacter adjunctus TaxID=1454001 RepID=A0A011MYD1_9PROT|nr:MAG: Peptidase propeptide and YPEB domain protein [Candidatus Accumulibacter adjunctus]
MTRAPPSLWQALACAAWLLASPAIAHASDDHDHDRARQAVEAGEILPLARVLERVEQLHPGQVIDVELEREHDARWIYKLKVLQRGGALIRLKVDARDGTVLGSRTREKDKERH